MAPTNLPVRVDLTIYQRGDWTYYRNWYWDDNGTEAVLDTTGWNARMAVKENKEDTTYLLDSDAGDISFVMGLGTVSGHQYSMQITIPGSKTSTDAFIGFVGVYDLWLQDTSGRWMPYDTGRFCVDGSVADV